MNQLIPHANLLCSSFNLTLSLLLALRREISLSQTDHQAQVGKTTWPTPQSHLAQLETDSSHSAPRKRICVVFRLSPFLLNNRKWNMGSQRKYFLWEATNVLIRTLQVRGVGWGGSRWLFPTQHANSKFSGLSTARNSTSKHWYITTVTGGTEFLSLILNVCLQNKDSSVLLPLYHDIAQTGLEFMIFLPRPPQSTNAF